MIVVLLFLSGIVCAVGVMLSQSEYCSDRFHKAMWMFFIFAICFAIFGS